MTKSDRILIEMLVPPFLAGFLITVTGCGSDSFLDRIVLFPIMLMLAYAFGILPSLLYMVAMELWFKLRLHDRCGMFCTVGLSGLLGTGAGFMVQIVVEGLRISYLLWVGALVGLIIGFYVGRKQTAEA